LDVRVGCRDFSINIEFSKTVNGVRPMPVTGRQTCHFSERRKNIVFRRRSATVVAADNCVTGTRAAVACFVHELEMVSAFMKLHLFQWNEECYLAIIL
jgi:hypothetical protein